jgi:hypothetical protein
VAVKLALAAPDTTVTEDGTETVELLLTRLILDDSLAAALSVTVQLSVPAAVNEVLAQVIPVKVGVEDEDDAALHPVALANARSNSSWVEIPSFILVSSPFL